MNEPLPPILTSASAAQLLHCAPTTVEERARTGDLPGEKFGEGWVFPTAAFLQRVNEIAIEQAAARRKTIAAGGAKAAFTLVTSTAGRQPPSLS